MPSIEKQEKSKLTGLVDDFLIKRKKISSGNEGDDNTTFLTIIDFIERFKLLPYGLFPVQKFILKLYYNIPLDDKLPGDERDRIYVTPNFRSNKRVYMTEVKYLEYLYSQGRCNIKQQDDNIRYELILVLGRRSGKSALASLIAAYELYKLLARDCPQKYYGMPVSSEIRVLDVANDKDQAEIVYQDIAGYVESVDYFRTSLANHTTQFMKFKTPHDKRKFGDEGRSTLTATFKSSIAKGLRGRGVICFILDEFAFFLNESGKSNAREVYRAIIPSLKQFTPKDSKDKRKAIAKSEGRTVVISSPDAKDGFFYHLYQLSLTKDIAASNMLMIQAPTWEVNPTLSQQDYEIEYAKDPRAFTTEYGAQFSDRVRGWIEDAKDLQDCIIDDLKPLVRGNPREPFWAGLDFGISKDGTSVALTHLLNGRITLGYHEAWYAGKSWKETNPHLTNPLVPYARTLQDVKRLDIDEIANWLFVLSKRFYILKGVFDQWAGPVFEQKLHKTGLQQFEMRHFSTADSSKVYQNAKMFMYTTQLAFYDYPIPKQVIQEDSLVLHSPLIAEMLELQATSAGKNLISVEAPNIPGKHDDNSDAVMRSIYLAAEYISENPGILDISHIEVMPMARKNYGYRYFHRARTRLHGPPPPERVFRRR